MEMGNVIKEYRLLRNMTQEELGAAQIGRASCRERV